jgi:poly(A) polymerase
VRDSLLGRAIGDIDIATPEEPTRVIELLAEAGIRVVPTGLKHGTVTAVVPPLHFEITTLRRDVETYGRHALVAYTDDWAADAARRDFTMNALFLAPDGAVYDYVGGLADLDARRVRFVGDAVTRIREDVLRLLRFYRFHAHYGLGPADEEARAACRALAPLVPSLSGERVRQETLKLLAAPDPVPTLELMRADGVLEMVLPEVRGLELLAALVAIEPSPDPVRRLAALLPDAEAAAGVALRLKLSNAQRDRLAALLAPPVRVTLNADELGRRRALHRLGAGLYRDLVLLRAAETGDTERHRPLLGVAASWVPREFPLKGRDVATLGIAPGPAIGRALKEVERWWEAGGYEAGRDACLARLRQLLGGV